jgi:pimeloyl-ACP methyl ester carboxylesterase
MVAGGLAALAMAALVWERSDPPGCVAGQDPAVALANARAGAGELYRDWCHEFAGNKLHVVEAGQGEVVLFIHGFPSIWYSMIRPMEALRSDYRVVAIDGLGAGLSDAPTEIEDYKLGVMADHLDALIAELGVERVHLVGHDWGSAFAWAYAQSRPEKLLSVTGMSAPPQNVALEMLETSEKQRAISSYVERLKSASPILLVASGARERMASGPENHFKAGRMTREEADMLQAATSDMRRINRQIHWYRANMPHPDEITDKDYWPSRNASLDVPALLIWGDDDTVFDPAFIDLMTEANEGLTVVRLPGIGHAPQFEAPDAVNKAIARHLKAR